MNRTGLLLSIDLGMLLLAVVLKCLSLTGLTLHEWLGFALCPLVLLHVTLQWSWFAAQFRRLWSPGAWRPRVNAFLNLTLLFVMAGTLISGILVSNQVVPLIGEELGRVEVWQWVHDCLNNFLLALVGLHVALNWNWLVAAMRRRCPISPAEEILTLKNNPTLSALRSTSFGTFFKRSLVVLVVAVLASVAAYAIFVPFARPPRRHEISQQSQVNAVTGAGTSSPAHPLAKGRPFSLPHGFTESAGAVLMLLVAIVVGRYIFRLRL